jgi:hypothetical protein
MFPEIPFPEELYGGKWSDKPKRKTFAHGFDASANLVLIDWYGYVAYRDGKEYLEAAFVNEFPDDYFHVQVVRHVYRDASGLTQRVINLAPDQGYDNRYAYERGKLVRIDSRYWEHDSLLLSSNRNKGVRKRNAGKRTLTFHYSADGTIRRASPDEFF